MDAIWQATSDAYMQMLYNGNPSGATLESIHAFEQKLADVAEQHTGNMDIAGVLAETGLQDEYNRLYLAVVNGNNDYGVAAGDDAPQAFDFGATQHLPSVHEFLDTYRVVYEQGSQLRGDKATDEAYQKLFDVENRTDDLIEAQAIIEREHLVINTLNAAYRDIIEEYMESVDPNFEVVTASVNATIGVYAKAKSIDEITYSGEIANSTTTDIAVQTQVKMAVVTNFTALVFAWENSKRKIRQGFVPIEGFAKAMVLARAKMRDYYAFMSNDLGLTFEAMEQSPFYRIMLLMPSALDDRWRVKQTLPPSTIEATRSILFEEMLSDRPLEEILLTPQRHPYYEHIDTVEHSEVSDEFSQIAANANKGIHYFDSMERAKSMESGESLSRLTGDIQQLNKQIGSSSKATGLASGATAQVGSMKDAFGNMSADDKKKMAADTAKDIGRGLLGGLFGR